MANGDVTLVKSALVSGCLASVYSGFQMSRIVLSFPFYVSLSKSSTVPLLRPSAVQMRLPSCSRIRSQRSAKLVPNDVDRLQADQKLKIGIVFGWALGDRWTKCDQEFWVTGQVSYNGY